MKYELERRERARLLRLRCRLLDLLVEEDGDLQEDEDEDGWMCGE